MKATRARVEQQMTFNTAVNTTAPAGVPQIAALCWRMHKSRIQVLLITSRETGRWVIPKGWAMEGRTPSGAAAREAWEEAGVEGEMAEESVGMFHYDKVLRPSKLVPCDVQVFALRVTRLASRFPERHQRSRKWFDLDTAARKVNEPSLRLLLAELPVKLTPPEAPTGLAAT